MASGNDIQQLKDDAGVILDDNAPINSIDPSDHLGIFDRLADSGRFYAGGLVYKAGNIASVQSDELSFGSNALNNTLSFDIEIGIALYEPILDKLVNDIIMYYKDENGRFGLYLITNVVKNVNTYTLTVVGFATNSSYTFASEESNIGTVSFYENTGKSGVDGGNATREDLIVLRNDTGANWVLQNPVLDDGEVGIENDSIPVSFKIGDGVSDWVTLPYFGGSSTPPDSFVGIEKSTTNIEINGAITSYYGNDTVRTGDITVDESVATFSFSARVKHNDTVEPGILFVGTPMDIVTLGSYSVGRRNDIWMSKTGANELLVNYTQPDDGQLSQFFLDDFPTAFFAYSIRKISSNALGYSMQTLLPVSNIEWDSNNETSNTSVYDGATVGDFTGTAVSLRWYEQISGLTTEFLEGNNAADSPTIIDSGTLVTASNGKAALSFDTGIRAMRKGAYTQLNSTNDFTIFIVASAATATGTEIGALLFSRDDTVGGNSAFGIYHDNRTDKLIGSVLNNSGGSTQFAEYITQQNNTDTRIITLVKSGNDLSFYLNDVLQQTVTYTGAYDNDIFVIGRRFDALDFDGYIQETFGFSSVINSADRTKIYNNLNAFFS